ncbi:hypothetical protein [Mesorhizobium loti]|uniref:hypothetical protein n=1 Tax=Rhizobium loti TaxID=381 RepID=UPI0003FE3E31|nr:hypothetical protein [Mesorhizobium loti]
MIADRMSGVVPPGSELLHMKNVAGAFGTIDLDSLRSGTIRVIDKETNEVIQYPTVAKLLDGGWAVD